MSCNPRCLKSEITVIHKKVEVCPGEGVKTIMPMSWRKADIRNRQNNNLCIYEICDFCAMGWIFPTLNICRVWQLQWCYADMSFIVYIRVRDPISKFPTWTLHSLLTSLISYFFCGTLYLSLIRQIYTCLQLFLGEFLYRKIDTLPLLTLSHLFSFFLTWFKQESCRANLQGWKGENL